MYSTFDLHIPSIILVLLKSLGSGNRLAIVVIAISYS